MLVLTVFAGIIEDERYHTEDLLCLWEESTHLQEVRAGASLLERRESYYVRREQGWSLKNLHKMCKRHWGAHAHRAGYLGTLGEAGHLSPEDNKYAGLAL